MGSTRYWYIPIAVCKGRPLTHAPVAPLRVFKAFPQGTSSSSDPPSWWKAKKQFETHQWDLRFVHQPPVEKGFLEGTAKERRAQPRSSGRRGGMAFNGSSSRGAPDFDPKVSGDFVSFPMLEGQSGAARREEGKRRAGRSRSAECRRRNLDLQFPRSGQLRGFPPSCVRTHILVIAFALGNHSCCLQHGPAPGDGAGMRSHDLPRTSPWTLSCRRHGLGFLRQLVSRSLPLPD